MTISTIDPTTGAELEVYAVDGGARVESVLERAESGQRTWRGASFADRAEGLRAIGRELTAAREELARLIVAEMGKTIGEARAEIDKSAGACEHYAAHGERYLAPEPVETEWAHTYVQFPPVGVVLAIMPWNYPVWQVMRAAAPILMAGNAMVLKHASNVTGCALALAEVVKRAGVVDGLLDAVVLPGSQVAPLIADRRIAAVTLTGSEGVGQSVAEACARELKPSVLELGGSDAFVVLADADLEEAARVGVRARFQNNGQSCIAAKRFIVEEAVAEEFEERFAAAASALVVGDPADEATQLGPMARADLRDELADQVARGVAAGGRLLAGGGVPDGPGAFHPATVVGGVLPGTPLFREETFGPAAAVVRARDAEHAIAMANDSPYGLSSSLWTADVDRARELSGRIEAGAVFVNAMSASDARLPFGGVKRSGWGRELGEWGIRAFTNVQSVVVAPKGE